MDYDMKRQQVVTEFLDWIYSVPINHLFKYHNNEELTDFFFGVECYPPKTEKQEEEEWDDNQNPIGERVNI